jgi:hypothetical protein
MERKYLPVIIAFILINALMLVFRSFLSVNGFDITFLLVANAILFFLSLLGFFIQARGLRSTNINAFIRGIYSSLLLKMVVIMIAVLVYILVAGGKVNQPSLFTSMGLYVLYTSLEVAQLMKISRRKPNA